MPSRVKNFRSIGTTVITYETSSTSDLQATKNFSQVNEKKEWNRPVHIIVPLYKSPELIPELFSSLIDCAGEIKEINGKVIIINDSPGHQPLENALKKFMPSLETYLDVKSYRNAENLGFLKTCNSAMLRAHAEQADIVLLNSDAIITPGALREMREVAASDPLISVVSPRSNNATICNSPYPDSFRSLNRADALNAHVAISNYLPRITYAPVAVGFCLLIRYEMVEEFGVFDPVYGAGYNEENDFIIRCNQRGYRAVLANHAFVFHLGSVSFSSSDTGPAERERKNREIFINRYPEYPRAVDRYFNSIQYKAEYLTAGLVPNANGKLRILFDARTIGPYFSGTFELAFNMISRFVAMYQEEFDCFIAINHSALVFHKFDLIHGLSYCWNNEANMAPFAAAIRLAQPFNADDMRATVNFAPIVNYLMLDTIALDCQQLDDADLKSIWSMMCNIATSIGYISDFSKDQFQRRFAIPNHVTQYVALCSTDVTEYAQSVPESGNDGHLLVVGNHYPHKNIDGLIDCLLELKPKQKIVVLGASTADIDGVVSYKAGELEQSFVDSLYDNAAVVLFPSFYEGFGLPIMHALARQKPVICRNIPVTQEIKRKTRNGQNIILCDSTKEIAFVSQTGINWISETQDVQEETWTSATTQLYKALKADIAKFDLDICARRLARANVQAPAPVPVNTPAFAAATQESLSQRALNLAKRGDGEALLIVEVDLNDVSENAACKAILDAAALLRFNGRLSLRLKYNPSNSNPLGINHQYTLWMLNFGFDAIQTDIRPDTVQIDAILQERWNDDCADQGFDERAFVEWVYRKVLDRAADVTGCDYWTSQLEQGYSRKEILAEFYCSAERQALVSTIFARSLE